MTVSAFPELPLARPSGRVSDDIHWTIYTSTTRQIPALRLKLRNARLAALFPHFPVRLFALRSAYLPKHTLNDLNDKASCDLLIQVFAPELVGGEPLAVWSLSADEVARLASANGNSGALVVEAQHGNGTARRQVLAPYWLDWRGWSGYVMQLAYRSHLTDLATLRRVSYELSLRGGDAPSGLFLAQAHILRLLNDARGAAEACLREINLHMDGTNRPTAGALEAFVLLGQLLSANHEALAAHAAFSLALWLNSNHHQALGGILPLLTAEEELYETVARLTALPVPPSNLAQMYNTCAQKVGLEMQVFERRLREFPAPGDSEAWSRPLAWVAEEMPGRWLKQLALA